MQPKDAVLIKQYYSWLCDLINIYPKKDKYKLLIKDLHRKKFKWFVPNDDNRAFEGKNLREKFCEEEDVEYEYYRFNDETSMLELILALAFRCDEIMADSVDSVCIGEWFWRILSNVELDKFDDDYYRRSDGAFEVDLILERIIKRDYERNGKGGLFPLKKAKKDQRKVELWYQMCQYLIENYYVRDVFL